MRGAGWHCGWWRSCRAGCGRTSDGVCVLTVHGYTVDKGGLGKLHNCPGSYCPLFIHVLFLLIATVTRSILRLSQPLALVFSSNLNQGNRSLLFHHSLLIHCKKSQHNSSYLYTTSPIANQIRNGHHLHTGSRYPS